MLESPRNRDDDGASAPQTAPVDGKTVPPEARLIACPPSPADAVAVKNEMDDFAHQRPASKARRRRVFPEIEGYTIRRLIARGGMGVVYEAVQKKLGRSVALKLLPTVMSSADPGLVKRFQQEAALVAKLHHNHIIPIYDFGESRDGYYYVMELLEGRALSAVIKQFAAMPFTSTRVISELLKDAHRRPDPVSANEETVTVKPGSSGLVSLSPSLKRASSASVVDPAAPSVSASTTGRDRSYYRMAAQWTADIADALHYAHEQGMIHRDIKPSNIFLRSDGQAMLLDFGLVKVVGEESNTVTGSIVGSYRYMSPEQCSGAKRVPLDARTDVYSLGATLYEVLTFQPAFAAEDRSELFHQIMEREPAAPRKLIPAVPADLDTICRKALEKAPSSRYQTAKEMADDLHLYLRGLPIVARPVGPVGHVIRFVRRHRAGTLTTVATLLLLIAVGVAVIYQRNAREDRLYALITEGGTFMKLGQWEKAESAFYQVLNEDSRNFRGLVNLAITKKELYYNKKEDGYLKESNELLDRVLEIEPQRNEIWNLKGIVLRTQGALDEAIAALERSLELDDRYYSTWVNLGATYALKGDFEQAERHLKAGATLMTVANDSLPWHNLAAVQLQLDRPEALQSIQKALQADKVADRKGVASQLLRAKLHLQLSGHLEPSLALHYARVAETNSFDNAVDPHIQRVTALAWLRTVQWAPAIEAAKAALEHGDMPSYPNLILAVAWAQLGDRELARRHLENARSAWPEELGEHGYQTTIRGGLLWLDSNAELQSLLQEAERLLTDG